MRKIICCYVKSKLNMGFGPFDIFLKLGSGGPLVIHGNVFKLKKETERDKFDYYYLSSNLFQAPLLMVLTYFFFNRSHDLGFKKKKSWSMRVCSSSLKRSPNTCNAIVLNFGILCHMINFLC